MVDFIVQSLGAFPLLLGLWLMGNRRLWGPFLAMIAEVFTTIVGWTHNVWSIVVIGAVLGIVQARNFVKWYREGVAW